MKTFRCTYVGHDGLTHTESIPACDPAAALGVLLDEQDVDECHDIRVSPARKPLNSKRKATVKRAAKPRKATPNPSNVVAITRPAKSRAPQAVSAQVVKAAGGSSSRKALLWNQGVIDGARAVTQETVDDALMRERTDYAAGYRNGVRDQFDTGLSAFLDSLETQP